MMNLTKIAAEFLRNPKYPNKSKIPAGLVPDIYLEAFIRKINELLLED